jgi:hypothetical protein
MNSSKAHSELAALRNAALDDLIATTEEQLRQEAMDEGKDLDAIAVWVGAAMQEAAAATLRHRLVLARERMQPRPRAPIASASRPPIESIKQLVQDIFQTDHSLGLAFREGKKQTDDDWLSLYDDLVALGAIKPDDHEG